MRKRLSFQQRRQMLDLLNKYNSDENLDYDSIPERFLDRTIWVAGENMPGYLPQVPYLAFYTERAARGYCRELERESGRGDYVTDFMPTTLQKLFGRG